MQPSVSQVLSVTLSMVIVYYVLGLFVSMITKLILELFNIRGKVVERFLRYHLLGIANSGQEGLLERLKCMPQLNALKPVRYSNSGLGFFIGKTEVIDVIERIPAENLVDALFDLAGPYIDVKEKANAIIDLLPDHLPTRKGLVGFVAKKNLKKFIGEEFTDLSGLRDKLETWVESLLNQASQEFKVRARRIVILLSVIVTLLFGVDSVELAKLYWNNVMLTTTAEAKANLILGSNEEDNLKNASIQNLVDQLEEMKALNFTWYDKPLDASGNWYIFKVIGILITIIAISQGSSFWYDILRQIKGESTGSLSKTTSSTTSPEWSVDSVNINWHH